MNHKSKYEPILGQHKRTC